MGGSVRVILIMNKGGAVREGCEMRRFLRSNGPIVLALLGLSFLWPYYQRSFFRVTLFHQLGDSSEFFFGLFLVVFLAGSLAFVVFRQRLGDYLANCRTAALAFAAVSLVATIYLSGLVASSAQGSAASWLFGCLATVGYACSLLFVSMLWAVLLMRIVYATGLFHAVSVLAASSILGFFLSPTFVASSLSMGFMPVCGVFVAGILAWFELGIVGEDADSPRFQPVSQAPYVKVWVAPLIAYLLFAVSHAIGYANGTSREVHVADGQLMAAASSFADYAVFLVFSAVILAAAVRSWRESQHYQEKATFWVASMGVSIGLFFGLFFADAISQPAFSAFSVMSMISPCFPILLAFISLLVTYQNRLSPLQSFGLFFFAMLAVEKLLAYVVLTPIFAALGAFPTEVARAVDVAIGAVSLISLLVFFVKFCQGNTLRMLFSAGDSRVHETGECKATAPHRAVCLSLARRHELTKRELDILDYLSLGYSAKRIGEMLFISERTVQTHTRNVYRKLDVHTRQDVIDLVEAEFASEDRLG